MFQRKVELKKKIARRYIRDVRNAYYATNNLQTKSVELTSATYIKIMLWPSVCGRESLRQRLESSNPRSPSEYPLLRLRFSSLELARYVRSLITNHQHK